MFLCLVIARHMAYECVGQFHPVASDTVSPGMIGLTAANRILKSHCAAMRFRIERIC